MVPEIHLSDLYCEITTAANGSPITCEDMMVGVGKGADLPLAIGGVMRHESLALR